MAAAVQSPLNFLIHEIASTFHARLWYAGIILCLTVPDICSASELDQSDEKFWRGQARYEKWCERYLMKHLAALTPADIWALRGGVIHRGQTFGHPKNRFERVVFILPDGSGNTFNGIRTVVHDSEQPVHSLDIHTFGNAFFAAAAEWIEDVKDNESVRANLRGLIRVRREGYENHLVGMPVIA